MSSGGGGQTQQVPSNFDAVASQNEVKLLNEQWSDYQNRFQPIAQKMIGQLGTGYNTTFAPENINYAQQETGQAFGNVLGQQERDLSRYGQGLSSAQTQQMNGINSLAKNAATVNNMNNANQTDINLRNNAVSGGLGTVMTNNNPNVQKVAAA